MQTREKNKTLCSFLLLQILFLLASGCGSNAVEQKNSSHVVSEKSAKTPSSHQSSIRFTKVSEKSGVQFTPRNGEQANHFSILDSIGTGVALFDYDRDGDLDLLLPGGGGYTERPKVTGHSTRLYRNEGGFRFTDVTALSGIQTSPLFTHGAYVADYDNDGWPDILLTGYGTPQLLHNRGDGTFEDLANKSGLSDSRWNIGAAWGDFNGDGHLDLYLAHYVNWSFQNHPICKGFGGARDICSPGEFDALDDSLFLNNGNGTFRTATKPSGLETGGKGLGVLAGDFDLDGDVDLYVANDTSPNFVYQNKGKGHFTEIGISSGAALGPNAGADGSMGLELADFNQDGRPDIWVTNYEHQNFALYRNDGPGIYQHVSGRMGIASVGTVYVGFGTVAADFDGDGDEDFFVTNGHVMLHSRNSPRKQHPLLFENLAGRQFTNVATQSGNYFKQTHRGRGVAGGDLNGDGKTDLVITNINEPTVILANESPVTRSSLRIRLIGIKSSCDSIGARVILHTPSGDIVRFQKSGASYLSTSDSTLQFSVKRSAFPVSAEIIWPGKITQKLKFATAGEFVVVEGRSPQRLPGQ
jgi:enediyne biosynthesis protein E4